MCLSFRRHARLRDCMIQAFLRPSVPQRLKWYVSPSYDSEHPAFPHSHPTIQPQWAWPPLLRTCTAVMLRYMDMLDGHLTQVPPSPAVVLAGGPEVADHHLPYLYGGCKAQYQGTWCTRVTAPSSGMALTQSRTGHGARAIVFEKADRQPLGLPLEPRHTSLPP